MVVVSPSQRPLILSILSYTLATKKLALKLLRRDTHVQTGEDPFHREAEGVGAEVQAWQALPEREDSFILQSELSPTVRICPWRRLNLKHLLQKKTKNQNKITGGKKTKNKRKKTKQEKNPKNL